jgi:hypothetical protein
MLSPHFPMYVCHRLRLSPPAHPYPLRGPRGVPLGPVSCAGGAIAAHSSPPWGSGVRLGLPRPAVACLDTGGVVTRGSAGVAALPGCGGVVSAWRPANLCANRPTTSARVTFGAGACRAGACRAGACRAGAGACRAGACRAGAGACRAGACRAGAGACRAGACRAGAGRAGACRAGAEDRRTGTRRVWAQNGHRIDCPEAARDSQATPQ